jgi:deazaflavin-dependent oxidoreductase (nitroreductase family)
VAANTEPRFERQRAPKLQQLLLKVPPLIYRGPIADLLKSRCVLVLTTRGRKTGQRRTTGVSFMPLNDRLVVFSGWGRMSNWYRNVLANPEVEVQVGRKRMRATARLVPDPERRRQLMLQMQQRSRSCGPPRPMRPLLKLLKVFDYEGEITLAVAQGGDLPVVEIVPHQ